MVTCISISSLAALSLRNCSNITMLMVLLSRLGIRSCQVLPSNGSQYFTIFPHFVSLTRVVGFTHPVSCTLTILAMSRTGMKLIWVPFVEARLDLRSWERLKDDDGVLFEDYYSHDVLGNVTNLIVGISNVQTLHLSPDSLEVIHFCCQSMPVFHNLITLSFESDKKRAWPVVPLLLRNSPNLKNLAIKGLVHQVTSRCGDACVCIPKIRKKKKKKMDEGVCCLSTCQVKVLNISAYQGTCRELKQMSHFLGNLKFLETVNVSVICESPRRQGC